MLKIFADRHHDGLAFSLRLLTKRIGAEIYFPIGEKWFTEGYWKIAKPYNNNPETVKQYLSLDQRFRPVDGTVSLNTIHSQNPLYYEIEDLAHGDTLRSITLQQFKAMDIDVVIASIPDHVSSFTKLIKDHKPKAKLVMQIGNIGWNDVAHTLLDNRKVLNLMASTLELRVPSYVNAVFYHQEMKLREYKEPSDDLKITSFVHLLPKKELYEAYKQALPEVEFRAFGAQCPDGYCHTIDDVYDKMQESSLIFHVKPMGDGFGHIWHSAFMLGRPIITNFSDYRDKLGGLLFEDLRTGIDLERRTLTENVELIKTISKDQSLLMEMCMNARAKFEEIVDYEEEAGKIKKFFERLI